MGIAEIRAAVREWLHDPVEYSFTDDQIDEFLSHCKVPDEDGYRPAQSDWTPTYDVVKAAGYGWLWLAGVSENKPMQYKLGDVFVTLNKNYCTSRARELMGSSCATATRSDEPRYEYKRKKYYDGINSRYRS